jgi:hypothetical protein
MRILGAAAVAAVVFVTGTLVLTLYTVNGLILPTPTSTTTKSFWSTTNGMHPIMSQQQQHQQGQFHESFQRQHRRRRISSAITSTLFSASTAAAASGGEDIPSLIQGVSSPSASIEEQVVTVGTHLAGQQLQQQQQPSATIQVNEEETQNNTVTSSTTTDKQKKTYQELRAEGGPLTFNTPFGALNPFAIYYGVNSILLGIPWFFSCKLCQLLYFLTGNRFDKKVRESIQ